MDVAKSMSSVDLWSAILGWGKKNLYGTESRVCTDIGTPNIDISNENQ